MGQHETTVRGFGVLLDLTDEFWKKYCKYNEKKILEHVDHELFDECREDGGVCFYQDYFNALLKNTKLVALGDLVEHTELLICHKDSQGCEQYAHSTKTRSKDKPNKKYCDLDFKMMTQKLDSFFNEHGKYTENGKEYKFEYELDFQTYYFESNL